MEPSHFYLGPLRQSVIIIVWRQMTLDSSRRDWPVNMHDISLTAQGAHKYVY